MVAPILALYQGLKRLLSSLLSGEFSVRSRDIVTLAIPFVEDLAGKFSALLIRRIIGLVPVQLQVLFDVLELSAIFFLLDIDHVE